jgi:hypothetical protein
LRGRSPVQAAFDLAEVRRGEGEIAVVRLGPSRRS